MDEDFGKLFDDYEKEQEDEPKEDVEENINPDEEKTKKDIPDIDLEETVRLNALEGEEAYGLTKDTKSFFKGLAYGFIGMFLPRDLHLTIDPSKFTEPKESVQEATEFEKKYGTDFKDKYGVEKNFFFQSAMFRSKNNKNIKMEELDPKYDLEKLGLILEGQIKGLDTNLYKNLNSKQIAQIMAAQLEGFSPEEINSLGNNKTPAEMMESRRQKMEIEKGMSSSTVVSYNSETRLNIHSQSLDDIIKNFKKETVTDINKDIKTPSKDTQDFTK